MDFLHTDLGRQKAGAIVEVTLQGTEANVLLLDQINFQNYRAHRQHRYAGGHYKRSPVVLSVPHSDHWHVAIDLGGGQGQLKASVSVRS